MDLQEIFPLGFILLAFVSFIYFYLFRLGQLLGSLRLGVLCAPLAFAQEMLTRTHWILLKRVLEPLGRPKRDSGGGFPHL